MAPHSSFALDFLRRLLCAHSTGDAAGLVRQRVADQEASMHRYGAREEDEGARARSPCIVARLMGLDAMPKAPPLRRSRSASSAEGWPPPCGFGDAPRPRVIRTTSATFREKPAYLRRENDEFLLLSFSPEEGDDDDNRPGFSLLTSRSDDEGVEIVGRHGRRRGEGAKKQRRGRRRPRRRCGFREELAPGRSGTPAECILQNSSPVSVLEARDGQEEESTTSSSLEEAEPLSPSSGEIQLAPRRPHGSRRNLIQPDSDHLPGGPLPAASSTCRLSRCAERERGDRREMNQEDEVTTLPDFAGILQLIGRLLEDDINGVMKWEASHYEKIAAEMESLIFDQIISETTDELIQLIQV